MQRSWLPWANQCIDGFAVSSMIRAGSRDKRNCVASCAAAQCWRCSARRANADAAAKIEMSYVRKSLVAGETLMYDTRHPWIVLLGPLLMSLLLAALGIGCLGEVVAARDGRGFLVDAPTNEIHAFEGAGLVLIVIAFVVLAWGFTKRNATEMAVTNKRVLIKTGLGNRRTLDLMLSRVESIGVEESFWGRML